MSGLKWVFYFTVVNAGQNNRLLLFIHLKSFWSPPQSRSSVSCSRWVRRVIWWTGVKDTTFLWPCLSRWCHQEHLCHHFKIWLDRKPAFCHGPTTKHYRYGPSKWAGMYTVSWSESFCSSHTGFVEKYFWVGDFLEPLFERWVTKQVSKIFSHHNPPAQLRCTMIQIRLKLY